MAGIRGELPAEVIKITGISAVFAALLSRCTAGRHGRCARAPERAPAPFLGKKMSKVWLRLWVAGKKGGDQRFGDEASEALW